jgi:ABC-type Fe3+-citrate transport system substrate-binding protein
MGLIAHELQEVYPFLVNGEKDGANHQSINYTSLIALLIKEMQEVKRKMEEMKQKINDLENK